jgi:transaldolase/glucose-6-phosphate isomerase
MNILVLGGRVIGVETARELVRAFLGAKFSGDDRHLRRLTKVIVLENPLNALQKYGQSVWLDYIRRSLITSGELQRMIDDDDVRGVTSNPSIFEKAVAGSTDYKDVLTAPESRKLDAKTLYERIAVRDIQEAADLLRPLYDQSKKRDGYVSLEVSPKLARDTQGTVEEAHSLWSGVARPNLMIKVPATEEGIPAIRQLIGEGINVNVTLLFGLPRYRQVAEAYIAGIEARSSQGKSRSSCRSRRSPVPRMRCCSWGIMGWSACGDGREGGAWLAGRGVWRAREIGWRGRSSH